MNESPQGELASLRARAAEIKREDERIQRTWAAGLRLLRSARHDAERLRLESHTLAREFYKAGLG